MIASVVTEPGHSGRIYNITTPESVSMEEPAKAASGMTGDRYRYEPISDAKWIERWRKARPAGLGTRDQAIVVRSPERRRV